MQIHTLLVGCTTPKYIYIYIITGPSQLNTLL